MQLFYTTLFRKPLYKRKCAHKNQYYLVMCLSMGLVCNRDTTSKVVDVGWLVHALEMVSSEYMMNKNIIDLNSLFTQSQEKVH